MKELYISPFNLYYDPKIVYRTFSGVLLSRTIGRCRSLPGFDSLPLLVKDNPRNQSPLGPRYQIIDGFRRFVVLRDILNWATIPCYCMVNNDDPLPFLFTGRPEFRQ